MDDFQNAYRKDTSRLVQEDGDVVNQADTIDEMLHALKTVTELEFSIHAGRAFNISGEGSISAGAKKYFLMETGSRNVHFMSGEFEFEVGDFLCTLTEDPIVSSMGTEVLTHNMNRVRPMIDSSALVYIDPTVTNEGSDMGARSKVMPTSKMPSSAALSNGRVLAPNSLYLLTVENLNGSGTHEFSYSLTYHEA